MNEFQLIQHFFAQHAFKRSDTVLGIGDDAAVLQIPAGQQLVVTTDTLNAGIHFPLITAPDDIGFKALAVNLSDLAAMGATPAWVTLALTLPVADEKWIQDFCTGFFALADRYDVQLIGGDLTRGPLSVTVQALGLIPVGESMTRNNAQAGDAIYVTGTLGDAGLALQALEKKIALEASALTAVMTRLNRPEPRVKVGEQLRFIAHAAIDISDGLAADLGHILEQSQVGANVFIDRVPLSAALQSLPQETAFDLALNTGDNYELCFTVPASKQALVEKIFFTTQCPLTCIGVITEQTGLHIQYTDGRTYHGITQGYQHF